MRDIEKALRDAGCSRNQAKEIVANGFKGEPNERDAQEEARLQNEREAQEAEEAHLREAEAAKEQAIEEKKPITKDRTAELLIKADLSQQ